MGLKKKGRKNEKMEEELGAEDWCFECKEGGMLVVCDYEHCLKAYHAQCVGDDKSLAKDPWFCKRHSCCECKKSSKYLCFGCPEGLCEHCFHDMHFARIRGNKGFCINCLKVALLGEEGIDVDSDGERVDLEDLETTEGLFFDYWKNVIQKKEGLTLEDLQSADDQIKKDGKYKASYKLKKKMDIEEEFHLVTGSDDEDHNYDDSDADREIDDLEKMKPKLVRKRKDGKYKADYKLKIVDSDEDLIQILSSSDHEDHNDDGDDDGGGDHKVDDVDKLKPMAKLVQERNRSIEQKLEMPHGQKQKGVIPKSKKDIVSWASECLLDFLTWIGEDTSERYEPINIASLIYRYADDNNLLHPEKPRRIVCDERLNCLFGKKMVDKNKVVDLIQLHFPEYLSSGDEEEETRCIPKQKEKKSTVSRKRQRNLATHKIEKEKEEPVRAPRSCFAFIVSENIKLVYLKKSLVQELLKEPETFESKVVGSFVRVRSDLGTGSRSYSFQLLPVTGINILSKEENNSENLLQLATLKKDVPIDLLSNDNFSEEECEDLKKKVKDGLIRRPTIAELENKAITLHEDITKHWIDKELRTLKIRMDQANEKGRRREYYGCYERQRLLRTPGERLRLLRKVPKVIPDVADDEPTAEVGTEEDETGKEFLKKSKLFESLEPITKDGSEEDERKEEISRKSMLESPELPDSHEEENGNSTGGEKATKQNHTAELVKKSNVPENQTNCIIREEREVTEQDLTAELVKENSVPVNQTNDVMQVAEEKKHHRNVSNPEENQQHSTEACFLEVMAQRSHHVPPQVEDNFLFESEFFQ